MPPLEANKILFRMFSDVGNLNGPHKKKMLFIDVRKAHLNGHCDRNDVFVELPLEANAPVPEARRAASFFAAVVSAASVSAAALCTRWRFRLARFQPLCFCEVSRL